MPRPIRASTSTASTPRTSSRSSPASRFGRPVDLAGVYAEGIRHVSRLDIDFAEELGYRIKLLGIARLTEEGLEQRVHPCMVPRATPIAAVEGVYNAVVAEGDFVGRVVLEGRGAGAFPTASAVAADLVDIAAGRRVFPFGIPAADARATSPACRSSATRAPITSG